jgi:hypothetical protein
MMSNREGSHHQHFEELCALAASGQISEAEFVQLQDHLQQCAPCRSTYSDFIDLLHDKLPLADPEIVGSSRLSGFFSEDSSYRERFLARARKEGLNISQQPSRDAGRNKLRSWFWPGLVNARLATPAMAVLVAAVGLLGYGLYKSNARYGKLASDQAELSKQLNRQSGPFRSVTEENNAPDLTHNTVATTNTPLRAGTATDAELAKIRADRAAAETRSKVLEEQLTKVASELEALKEQNGETTLSKEQLEKKLKDAEQLADTVKDDLQEIRRARSKDSLTISLQDIEIQKLSEKLTAQAETLEQEKALLEASRDVRDLMGARNFHIFDVYDVDSKGKDQRAFGRVFVGESTLIFYAFDLNDRNTAKRNASFQVWGQRGPKSPAYSLGLFQIDDQKLNRWVLRFEDPQILAKIDSVTVTVEPPGGSAKPTGRQFLYAYLNANPSRQ